jgi:hypothetical protein
MGGQVTTSGQLNVAPVRRRFERACHVTNPYASTRQLEPQPPTEVVNSSAFAGVVGQGDCPNYPMSGPHSASPATVTGPSTHLPNSIAPVDTVEQPGISNNGFNLPEGITMPECQASNMPLFFKQPGA